MHALGVRSPQVWVALASTLDMLIAEEEFLIRPQFQGLSKEMIMS